MTVRGLRLQPELGHSTPLEYWGSLTKTRQPFVRISGRENPAQVLEFHRERLIERRIRAALDEIAGQTDRDRRLRLQTANGLHEPFVATRIRAARQQCLDVVLVEER